jgi:hypothetical protein
MASEPGSVRRSGAGTGREGPASASLHPLPRPEGERQDDDGSFDVPAAVLCAVCGQADCQGCSAETEEGSGVVAIVPWERPGTSTWARLWATANATTQGAETFFSALPDGRLAPALRFALLAELFAVCAMLLLVAPLGAMALPNLAADVAHDPATRLTTLRWLAAGVPAVAAWMVLAHAAHGLALDLGARRNGGRPQRGRALRFGLYACGWDLMTGPLGALVLLLTKGAGPAADLFGLSMGVPGRASMALLMGVYGLRADQAAKARRAGTLVAVVTAIASGFAVLALALL